MGADNIIAADTAEADGRWSDALAEEAGAFCRRIAAAVGDVEARRGEVAILLTDDEALRALNRKFRDKDGPTNVLAFPPQGREAEFLGDIALAFETAHNEACAQGKDFVAHAAHLIVHGVLHLLGHDHVDVEEAARMEAQERAIMEKLGWPDPYGSEKMS